MNKRDILKRVQLFKNISSDSLSRVADICLPRKVSKKEILFHEGDKGFSFYVLVKGNIQLYKTSEEGKETVIKIIKPGEMFAEVILFEKNHYPVSAVALTDSQLFILPKHQFICLLEEEQFRSEFITSIMNKLRFLTTHIKYLTNYDVEERLFMFLEEQFGKQDKISIKLSKKDVAAAIGSTPETLSRLLLRLKNEGKMIWEGSKITTTREF